MADGPHDSRRIGHCPPGIQSLPAKVASFCHVLPDVTVALVVRIFRKSGETPIPRPIKKETIRAARSRGDLRSAVVFTAASGKGGDDVEQSVGHDGHRGVGWRSL